MDSTKSNIENVKFIENWPSAGNRIASKIPTVISYQVNRADDDHRDYRLEDVGFEVLPGAQHIDACFKLLLDEKAKLIEFNDPTVPGLSDLVAQLGKSAKDIATDYLTEIFSCIRTEFARQGLSSVLTDSPLDFCITFPAT